MTHQGTSVKGNSLIVKGVVALGSVPSHAGKVRGFLEKNLGRCDSISRNKIDYDDIVSSLHDSESQTYIKFILTVFVCLFVVKGF